MNIANLLRSLKSTFSQEEVIPPTTFEEVQGWVVQVQGTVTGISQQNIDKSGRNPKFALFLTVQTENVDYKNCNFEIGESVQFRAKDSDVIQAIGRQVFSGDRVVITSQGSGQKPRLLSVSQISLCDGIDD